jgi:DNA-binding MarR family transcriptional regulator
MILETPVNPFLAACHENADLTVRQCAIMAECALRKTPEERQVKELAAAIGSTKSTLSRAADRLHGLGWIKTAALPYDRRTAVLTLTDSGREAVRRMCGG